MMKINERQKLVLAKLNEGVPVKEMPKATGLSSKQVRDCVASLWQKELLPAFGGGSGVTTDGVINEIVADVAELFESEFPAENDAEQISSVVQYIWDELNDANSPLFYDPVNSKEEDIAALLEWLLRKEAPHALVRGYIYGPMAAALSIEVHCFDNYPYVQSYTRVRDAMATLPEYAAFVSRVETKLREDLDEYAPEGVSPATVARDLVEQEAKDAAQKRYSAKADADGMYIKRGIFWEDKDEAYSKKWRAHFLKEERAARGLI